MFKAKTHTYNVFMEDKPSEVSVEDVTRSAKDFPEPADIRRVAELTGNLTFKSFYELSRALAATNKRAFVGENGPRNKVNEAVHKHGRLEKELEEQGYKRHEVAAATVVLNKQLEDTKGKTS